MGSKTVGKLCGIFREQISNIDTVVDMSGELIDTVLVISFEKFCVQAGIGQKQR